MGNQLTTPTAPSDDPVTPNRDEPDTVKKDSTCVVSPSRPSDSLLRKIASKSKKEADEGDRGERKKKPGKACENSTTGRKSARQQQQSSGRSSKSTTSKSSSRGKNERRREENVDSLELEFRRVFRGEGREKARFVSNVQEPAEVPNIAGSSVRFESKQTVVNVIIPHHRTFKKKNRSKHDPWRRYGALRKLHLIGGFAFHARDLRKNSSRRSRGVAKTRIKYYEIKKNEPFILPPPNSKPITKLETLLEKDKKRRNSK